MINDDSFGCLGIPSPLEMWQQHAGLLQAEVDDLYRYLRAARMSLIKVADLHAKVVGDRDKMAIELAETKRLLSNAYLELSQVKNSLNSRLFMEERAESERRHLAIVKSGAADLSASDRK